MKHDFETSLSFLKVLYPDGPWMLTAISVDKKGIEAKTFFPDQEQEVLAWLELYKKRNLYYSVNRPIPSAYEKRKLSKTDVESVHYLHVDVDPRAGEDLEEEQSRILELVQSYKIKPSILIFSGGGYNALWRLSEPIPLQAGTEDDTIARAIDVERRNWQFELDFDTPDHCRDVSRILRLPGTINWPNQKKIEQYGRTPALAELVSLTEVEYEYSQFMATPHVSQNKSSAESAPSGNIERVENLDHLKIPDKLKVIIAQGFDPEDKEWNGDRSAVLYFVCCELVRCGISDEIILGIITDSRYGISQSVLDKGSSTQRYAIRQVQRARDNADNPLLAEMNEKFAVILSYGSQTVVMVEQALKNADTGQYEPVFQTFNAFRNRIKSYPMIRIELPNGKDKFKSAFDWWTSHRRRREYREVVFEPGLDTPDQYNLWTGFACSPTPGERHKRLLSHIFENICSRVSEHYDYLIKWMARVVQHPRTPSMVAPVLLGERGTGKSIFCDFFGDIFAPHRHTVSDTNALTGKFNAHLAQCIFVVAEEAFDLRDKRHESVLKEHITGRAISIERKGLDRIQMKNYTHLIMTSNNERVVPAGDHERRFFVLKVSNQRRQDSEYFGAILEDQRMGGVSHLLHYLLSLDLSDYDVTDVPQTEELRDQQEHNLPWETEWLLEKLEQGHWGVKSNGDPWQGPVQKKLLYDNYRNELMERNIKTVRGQRAFHKFISKEIPGVKSKQIYSGTERPMTFIFPPIEVCREEFDANRGWSSHEWPEPMDLTKEGDVIDMKRSPFE